MGGKYIQVTVFKNYTSVISKYKEWKIGGLVKSLAAHHKFVR